MLIRKRRGYHAYFQSRYSISGSHFRCSVSFAEFNCYIVTSADITERLCSVSPYVFSVSSSKLLFAGGFFLYYCSFYSVVCEVFDL